MQLERMHLRKFGVSMQLIRVTSTRICDVSQQGRARAAAHLGVERDRREFARLLVINVVSQEKYERWKVKGFRCYEWLNENDLRLRNAMVIFIGGKLLTLWC